jgi:hypothetical protein
VKTKLSAKKVSFGDHHKAAEEEVRAEMNRKGRVSWDVGEGRKRTTRETEGRKNKDNGKKSETDRQTAHGNPNKLTKEDGSDSDAATNDTNRANTRRAVAHMKR